MAKKARQRALVANDRYQINGNPLVGTEIIILGPCSSGGRQKDAKGKALPKKEQTHLLVRFSDRKRYKELGLPVADFVVSHWSLKTFFEIPDA